MKAVLLSIRPNWCDLILRGKKTMEVRKNYPKRLYGKGKPFKVYIYCTKAPQQLITIFKDGEETMDGEIHHGKPVFVKFDKLLPDSVRGKTQMVVGEFVCDKIDKIVHVGAGNNDALQLNIEIPDGLWKPAESLFQAACMNKASAEKYLQGRNGYGLHISDLKIYDKPRSLHEFVRFDFQSMNGTNICGNMKCENYMPSDSWMQPPECAIEGCHLKRPPQSWCYVEVAD